MRQIPRLALTLGDPCGIGPELLLKSLPALTRKWRVRVYGSQAALSILRVSEIEFELQDGRLSLGSLEVDWVDPLSELSESNFHLGAPSGISGKCAVEAVRSATLDIMAGNADAMLTLPISKASVHMAGYNVPGHTELLRNLTGVPRVQMAFISTKLKVVLHTVHQSLRSVVEDLNARAVADTLIFTAQQFVPLLNKHNFTIALCALNPHAGELGAFGKEEGILKEAVEIAQNYFSDSGNPEAHRQEIAQPTFCGPLSADTIFLRASRGEFDVVVALYHDQGLIPVKLLEPESAVNFTLGLPFIRTSPDHGTAFDIAGKWVANPSNTLAAADLAFSLLR